MTEESSSEEIERLKRELREETKCPLTLGKYDLSDSLREVFSEYWQSFVEGYEVETEGHYADPDMIEIDDHLEDSLRPGLHNWRLWGPRARKDFLARIDHLLATRMADRTVYPKHYPPANLSRAQICALSGSRDSLLFYHATSEYQRDLLHTTIATWARDFLAPSHRLIYIADNEAVGASCGEVTRVLCYDLNFPSRTAHAYPVRASDMETGRKLYAPYSSRDPPHEFIEW